MKILVSSDSVCDLPASLIKKYDIPILPLPITLGNKTLLDGIEVSTQQIFDFVDANKTLPKTSAINQFSYNEFFSAQLQSYDAIIHFTLSSKLSLCYENAKSVAGEFKNVFVVDSCTLSSGVGLLILKAISLIENNVEINEVYNNILALRSLVSASFVIEKLDYLHKGGRCSSLKLLGANVLKLRPSIKIKDGALQLHKKYKGKMENVIDAYVSDTIKENPNYNNEICFITYSSATKEMLESAQNALKKYANFKKIYLSQASATITSHCGKNTLGILFLNN